MVHELMEARDDRRLLNLQRQLARLNLLDELKIFSQRYERGWPFDEWTEVFGGKAHRGTAGPPHPPRAHPGDERRQL